MTQQEFKSLYKQAGFKNKNALAIFLGSSHSAVNGWGTQTKPFPKYIKPLLESLAKVRELEHTIQDLQAQIKKDSKH